ncbi:MAG: XRE family transcriptional regulator [Mediterranea sp.]|jgi:ribosome-binding protein aMBF1 (putative translation factor)|nr:XRE family transcriptional regulator [Mediterranea sp.]
MKEDVLHIQIGSVVEKAVRSQGISISSFARQLGCDRTNVYKIFKKEFLDIPQMRRIEGILGIDLWHYYLEYFGSSHSDEA